MTLRQYIPIFLACLFVLTSCVSRKKYEQTKQAADTYFKELGNMEEMGELNQQYKQDLSDNENILRSSLKELEEATIVVDRLQRENSDLLKRYNELLDRNNAILNNSAGQVTSLEQALSTKESELNQREQELDGLQYELERQQQSLGLLQGEVGAREARIAELQSQLDAQRAQMASLKSSINQAIRGYSGNDLNVEERNGKLYVSLSQDLLFSTGSDVINWKGKQAIAQLAQVFTNEGDYTILVEGHTDTDGTADANWTLSTNRAIAVTKILVANGVSPAKLTAAGRAFYAPIAPNDTPDNKAKNRRTEIILSPNLDGLYDISN